MTNEACLENSTPDIVFPFNERVVEHLLPKGVLLEDSVALGIGTGICISGKYVLDAILTKRMATLRDNVIKVIKLTKFTSLIIITSARLLYSLDLHLGQARILTKNLSTAPWTQ